MAFFSKISNVKNAVQSLVVSAVLLFSASSVWALTTSALKDLTCAGFRSGAMNCTAGEFTVAPIFSAAPGTPPFCVAGNSFNFQVELGLSGTNADRYNIGFFVGQQGNDPRNTAPGNICSVATFPTNPLPWKNIDGDTCGDFVARGNQTTTVNEIKVLCAGDTTTGSLTMPYVVTYWQNTSSVCTGPANVENGAPSKCNSGTGSVSGVIPVKVGAYVDVTKATLPAGNTAQSFSYTATGPIGSKVGAQVGSTFTPDNTPGNQPINTVTVSIKAGQTARFFIDATSAGQTLTITEAATPGWESAANAIRCSSVTGSPPITTSLANRSIAANLSLANSAASCTITNQQSAKINLVKTVVGRVSSGDQFTVNASGGGTLQGTASATTAGTATSAATTFYSSPGAALTLADVADVATGTSLLSNYESRLTCTNALSGTAGYTSNASLPNNASTTSASITPVAGDDISCIYTNTPKPRVTLNKVFSAAGGGRVSSTDQFVLAMTGATSVTTTGTGASVTSTPVSLVAAAGTAITLSETAAATTPATSLGNYVTTYACTNTGTGGTVVTSDTGSSFTFTPVNNDVMACTFTNTRKSATLTLRKTWVSGVNGDTATVSSSGFVNNASSGLSTSSGNNTTTGSAVTVYAGETGAIGETFGIGAAASYSASLACTGNTTPLSGSNLTVNAADTVIVCSFTNAGAPPPSRLNPTGAQTAQPGTVVFYAHNFYAGSDGQVTFTLTNVATPTGWPWNQVLYRDSNCNGTLDAAESVIAAPIALAAEQTLCLIIKQFVPAGIASGAQNATTLSASYTTVSATDLLSAVDVTTVTDSSVLALTKRVSNITHGGASGITANANPGETLQYTLTAVNNGSMSLSTVSINDATPAFTTYLSAACPVTLPAVITACTVSMQPAVGAPGSVQWTFAGVLAPTGQLTVTYHVKVNQ